MESDVVVRIVVVGVALLITVAIARIRPARKPAPLSVAGNLDGPGVFLFTSSACDSCAAARDVYLEALGADGFTEYTWEDDAALLSRLGVEEIPVGTVLSEAGTEVAAFRLVPSARALRRAAARVR